jgi:hypothetical protein
MQTGVHMQKRTDTIESIVYSFDLKDARKVQAHTLHNHILNEKISDWESGEFAEYVAFWTFDDEAQMGIETLVHWTKVTQYMCRKWPGYGGVKFILTNKGQKRHAKSYVVGTVGEREYNERPVLLQLSAIRISALCSGQTYLEIKGANEYCYSERDDAAKAKFNVCPVEEKNRAFREEMQRRQEEHAKTL